MQIRHWDEGQSWSCLPHAVAGFVGTFVLHAQGHTAWSFLPLGIGIAFLLCRSGCSWDEQRREFRTFTGWKWANRNWNWGKRQVLPLTAELRLHRTKETMMNRRGAPNAVKIDSWELQWREPQGTWGALHDFTDRHLAQEVLDVLSSNKG
jgi:hypothetical protein